MNAQYTVGVPGWFACAWSVLSTRTGTVLRGLGVMLFFSIIVVGAGFLPGGAYIALLVQLTAGVVLQAGWYLFCLKLVRGGDPSPSVILEPFGDFGRIWLVSIVVSLMTAAGLIFFIVPGLYLWARFGLSVFAAVDRRLDVDGSLEFSSRITEGSRLQVLLLTLILAALGLFFMIPGLLYEGSGPAGFLLLIYQLIMIPLTGAAYAAAYDSLVETKVAE